MFHKINSNDKSISLGKLTDFNRKPNLIFKHKKPIKRFYCCCLNHIIKYR